MENLKIKNQMYKIFILLNVIFFLICFLFLMKINIYLIVFLAICLSALLTLLFNVIYRQTFKELLLKVKSFISKDSDLSMYEKKTEIEQLYLICSKVKENLSEVGKKLKYLDDIIENLLDGVIVTKGLVIDKVNGAACDMLGSEKEDLVGKNISEIFVNKALTGNKLILTLSELTAKFHEKFFEEYLYKKDGTRLAVLFSASTLINEDGFMDGAVCVIKDITAIKTTDFELKKLSNIVDQSPYFIIITDRFGIIDYINVAVENFTGYSKYEVIGKKCNVFKSGKQAPEFYAELWKKIKEGEEFRGVFVNKKKNGELYYEEKIIFSVKDYVGNILYFISYGLNISDRVADNERVKRYLQDLESFKKLSIGREIKMIELKKQINELNRQLNNEVPFKSVEDF